MPETDHNKKFAHGRTARRKARKHAVDVLFEADLRGVNPQEVTDFRATLAERELPEYAGDLIQGVATHQEAIDELISTYSEGWNIERMPAVDRVLLRIAIYEIMYKEDVPDVVAIDEAIALAVELSTDESPKFINGILGRIQLTR